METIRPLSLQDQRWARKVLLENAAGGRAAKSNNCCRRSASTFTQWVESSGYATNHPSMWIQLLVELPISRCNHVVTFANAQYGTRDPRCVRRQSGLLMLKLPL